MQLIFSLFYFFLPAGAANVAPTLFRWLPFLDIPVDGGKTFHGRPITGAHKTYRGFVVGLLMAIFFAFLQKWTYPAFQEYSLVDYSHTNAWLLGLAHGSGALLGDLVKSVIKRRLNIAPGKPWIPFDQLDWIIGALIATYTYIHPNFLTILITLLLFGILHPIFNLIGFTLRIKKNLL